MKILGRRELYKVQWRRYAFTHGIPVVHIRVKNWLGFNVWKQVWVGKIQHAVERPGQLLPDEVKEKFESIVAEYERHADVWDPENWKNHRRKYSGNVIRF